MYLDNDTVQDYASSLSSGAIERLTEISRSGLGREELKEDDKSSTEEEIIRESTMKITAKHLFGQIYDELGDTVKVYDEDEILGYDEIRRTNVVEVTRSFHPSAINDMMGSILDLFKQMQQLGFAEEVSDPEVQQGIRAMAMIFRGDEGKEELPMVSKSPNNDTATVFLAKTRFMLVSQEDFQGEMTVFGTVKKKVPEGDTIDLFDFLKLPKAMRGEGNLKKELFDLFESWPKELGGPIDRKNTVVPGPAIVVTPVAVYEA